MTREGIRSFMAAGLRRFGYDDQGVSAIEFAVLLPLMLTLYLGGVEVSQAVSANRKATLVAHTVSDLVAQLTNATTTAGVGSVNDVLAAASTVAYPFPLSSLRITVSSVCIDSTGQIATIAWSRATANATARSGTVTSSIDSRLMGTANAGTSLIWGEASYDYRPTVGWTITGTLTLSDKSLSRPRQGKPITLDGANGCPPP